MPKTTVGGEVTDLTSDVTGILPTANGGTNSSADANTANGVVVLDGSGYCPNNSVDTGALKTAIAEVSGTGNDEISLTITGGSYCFLSQIKMSDTSVQEWSNVNSIYRRNADTIAGWTTYATVLDVVSASGKTSYGQTRYVTASGSDHWLFLLLDKVTKDIIAASSAFDHPAYGNGGNFNKMPHPFISYDKNKHEVVLLDKETCTALKQESEQAGRSILTLVNDEYKPNTTKEEIYEPLHTGQFLGKDPVVLKTIPDYIKVRKSTKLTDIEKRHRETRRQQLEAEYEHAKAVKECNKQSAITKLIALGLTREEVEAYANK